MNLKESFRYQKFLDGLMTSATYSITQRSHCLKIVKTHNRKVANPDAEDITEKVISADIFYPNDDVIRFMGWLVKEKERLSIAIGKAKASIDFDIDAAVDTNKQRQHMCSSIKTMLRYTPSTTEESGKDYKFNAEGNQMPYYYNITTEATEAFDRKVSKDIMRTIVAEADRVSTEIDSAMINTMVDYVPVYDVNDTFEDVMAEFVESTKS